MSFFNSNNLNKTTTTTTTTNKQTTTTTTNVSYEVLYQNNSRDHKFCPFPTCSYTPGKYAPSSRINHSSAVTCFLENWKIKQ